MKRFSILGIILLAGCSRLHTTIVDGTKRTETSAFTFFNSKSDLAKFSTGQTDKSQRTSIGTLGQESSDTNIVNIIQAVTKGAVQGAAAAIKP